MSPSVVRTVSPISEGQRCITRGDETVYDVDIHLFGAAPEERAKP